MGKSIEWKMDSCGKAAIIYREGEQYALSQVVNGYFEQKQRIEELEALRCATCVWREDTRGEYWSTECGQAHSFTVDGPRENSHNFCPYCRGRLIAVAWDGKR